MSISPFHRSILFSRLPSSPLLTRPTISNPITLLLPSIQSRSYARKRKKEQKDVKIQMIDYALAHPVGGRPFKWSYIRTLRHWTIQQAWLLFKRKQKTERELELERQYNKIHDACEELKRCDERLFRIATDKKGVGTFPREMRIPTDTPPRGGFNEEWKRPKDKLVKKK
ncbi:hypothetical protein TWF481_001255 [Arthrobotrys musiformis]|uniref:Large ribosomal subunit protein mL40 n=1 Tax=Arthrobotrys musiformis TaxID=47236 RepID=A0AAV9WS43_9PEZI